MVAEESEQALYSMFEETYEEVQQLRFIVEVSVAEAALKKDRAERAEARAAQAMQLYGNISQRLAMLENANGSGLRVGAQAGGTLAAAQHHAVTAQVGGTPAGASRILARALAGAGALRGRTDRAAPIGKVSPMAAPASLAGLAAAGLEPPFAAAILAPQR